MEFASYLAGEPWSDHPSCTNPLLAQLARQVNDTVGDEGRQQLVPLIPSVVGLSGEDDTWLRLPVRVAAIPILDLPQDSQRVLAAGLSSAERLCAEAGPDLDETRREARAALDLVPGAVAWVDELRIRPSITARAFADRCAPTMIRCAVAGLAKAGAPDRDLRLRGLLEAAIAVCRGHEEPFRGPEVVESSWAAPGGPTLDHTSGRDLSVLGPTVAVGQKSPACEEHRNARGAS
jgi:hypothetical protein